MNRDLLLEIEGGLLEKLLCRALDAGAEFAEVRRISDRKICIFSNAQSAALVMELCERYRLKCHVLSRGGCSALVERLRRRWTLLPCCLICLLLSLLFLGRLWRMDVAFTGPVPQLGDERRILQSLEEAGLHPGMLLGEIDTDLLQKQLLADCDGYSFIGVRLQGIRLLVEAAPELPSPTLYDRNYARDLVASRDGVVVSVNARSGTACVKPGDTVRAGQTLIRGEEDKSKEERAPVAALGEVIARCWFEGSAEAAIAEERCVPTGQSREECSLKLMGFSLPLTQCEAFSSEEIRMERLPVVGLYLPLEIERSIHLETRSELCQRNPAILQKQLSTLARAEALAKVSREGIVPLELSFWEECSLEGGMMQMRAVAEGQTDIAVTRDYFD